MSNSKRKMTLDDVLASYALAAPEFDANVLQDLVNEHPEHASALRRFAQLQLTSVAATPEEVEEENVGDDELLPLQSKILQKMQALRGVPSSDEMEKVAKKLGSISGMAATRAATLAVFGAIEHGEDTLLLCVIEPPGVTDVPEWFFVRLGSHIAVPAGVLKASLSLMKQGSRVQRYSASEKLVAAEPVSWIEAVRDCINDEKVLRTILESPGPPPLPDNNR
jgi:hypothetical protein